MKRIILAILILFALIFALPTQSIAQSSLESNTFPPDTIQNIDSQAIIKILSQLGIEGDGTVESYITGFLDKYSCDITSILKGETPFVSTAEGLMSITSLAAGLIMQSPILKAAFLTLGAAGTYNVLTDSDKILQTHESQATSIEQKEGEIPSTAAPMPQPLSNYSSGYFNTVKIGKKEQ